MAKTFTKIRKWAEVNGYEVTDSQFFNSITVKINEELSFEFSQKESTIYHSVRGMKGRAAGLYMEEQRKGQRSYDFQEDSQKVCIEKMERVIAEDKKEAEEAAAAEAKTETKAVWFNAGPEAIKIVPATEEVIRSMGKQHLANYYDESDFPMLNLEEGYYLANGAPFKVVGDAYVFPLFQQHPLKEWVRAKWEQEELEKEAARKLSEAKFEADVDTKLDFGTGPKPRIVQLNEWKGRKVAVKEVIGDSDVLEVLVDGRNVVDLYRHEGGISWSCYDGVEAYRTMPSPKRAIKAFLEEVYPNWPGDESYEVSCTSCGDGGCIHCSPSDFL